MWTGRVPWSTFVKIHVTKVWEGVAAMSITIDFTPADIQLIQQQATAGNVSIEQFSREAILKAARNAEYIAKLRKSEEQINQGNVVKFSDEEWERFINA